MGKQKKAKTTIKNWRKIALAHQDCTVKLNPPKVCKNKCCKKFKKCENKRCSKCPCFDLLKKVA